MLVKVSLFNLQGARSIRGTVRYYTRIQEMSSIFFKVFSVCHFFQFHHLKSDLSCAQCPHSLLFHLILLKHHPQRLQNLPAAALDKLAAFPKTKCSLSSIKGVLIDESNRIVRRIDDLGRVVIPKEIRRTMRIREGDPSQITLARWKDSALPCWICQKDGDWIVHSDGGRGQSRGIREGGMEGKPGSAMQFDGERLGQLILRRFKSLLDYSSM